MSLTAGIIFGLISMLGFGLGNALSKIPTQKLGAKKTVFLRNVFISLILIIVLFFFFPLTISFYYIVIALLLSLIGYIAIVTFFAALKVGKVGVVSPIGNSAVIFTVIFSIIFFNETLNSLQLISISLIVLGIILISIDFSDIKNSDLFKIASGVPLALLTCLFWGILWSFIKIPVSILGPVLTSLILEFGIVIFSGIHLKIKKEKFGIDKNFLGLIIIIALFTAAGTLFFNFGLSVAKISIVAPLAFANPLVSALYGRIFFKEKLSFIQWMGVLLIVLGIILISI